MQPIDLPLSVPYVLLIPPIRRSPGARHVEFDRGISIIDLANWVSTIGLRSVARHGNETTRLAQLLCPFWSHFCRMALFLRFLKTTAAGGASGSALIAWSETSTFEEGTSSNVRSPVSSFILGSSFTSASSLIASI